MASQQRWIQATTVVLLGSVLTLSVIANAQTAIVYPEPAYLSDYAGILTSQEKAALGEKVIAFKNETSNEIAILIVPTTEPETIEQYSIHVTDEWKIGKKDLDNGVLFTVAINDRKMRLEIGRGLEGAITDVQSVNILDTYAKPEFKKGNYAKGINDTIDVVMGLAKGEFNVADMGTSPTESNSENDNLITFLFYGIIAGCSFLADYLARSKSWWLGGIIGAGGGSIVGLILGFGVAMALSAGIAFGIIGLIWDYLLSRGVFGKVRSGLGGWFGGGRGGSGGGWSSGGSSFGGGGFSGGGGSSSW